MSYIYDALRLPIGKANGIYKGIIPEILLGHVLKELGKRNGVPINEILTANAFGTGGNMGRYAALHAGFPENIPVTTIDSQCSGGLRAVEIAHSIILSGNAECIIAGGMESRSMAPQKAYHTEDPRYDSLKPFYRTATFSPGQKSDFTLLNAAENTAKKYDLTKQQMVDWTQRSHARASEASYILNPYIFRLNASHIDQSVRPGIHFSRLSTPQLIDRTVSAHYNDGAAAILLGNKDLPLRPLAKIIASFSTGWNPEFAPEAIIPAVEGILKKSGMNVADIDIFEINESFSLIPLIFARRFEVSPEKINLLGGTLAYGHPFGASGTINLIHLIATMKMKGVKRGLVALPAAGGLATAMIIDNVF